MVKIINKKPCILQKLYFFRIFCTFNHRILSLSVSPIAGFSGYSLLCAIYSNTGSTTFSRFSYSNSDNINYLNPIPTEAGTGSNVAFTKTSNENKFTLPFQGGTDGTSYAVIKKIGASIATTKTFTFPPSKSSRHTSTTTT
jgi:hypothetical protein